VSTLPFRTCSLPLTKLVGCLARREKRHIMQQGNEYLVTLRKLEMLLQVSNSQPILNILCTYYFIDTEDGQDISRSSSVSVKDRTGAGKRGKPGKQRRDDSESFDVRSQYTPFFPPQQQPSWSPVPQYGPMVSQFNNTMQNTYPGAPAPTYGQPPQQFHAPMMGSGMMPTYNQMPPNQVPQHHMAQNQMNQVSQLTPITN